VKVERQKNGRRTAFKGPFFSSFRAKNRSLRGSILTVSDTHVAAPVTFPRQSPPFAADDDVEDDASKAADRRWTAHNGFLSLAAYQTYARPTAATARTRGRVSVGAFPGRLPAGSGVVGPK